MSFGSVTLYSVDKRHNNTACPLNVISFGPVYESNQSSLHSNHANGAISALWDNAQFRLHFQNRRLWEEIIAALISCSQCSCLVSQQFVLVSTFFT